MAALFTVLCGLTVLMLMYFGYYFARGHFVDGTEAIIDTEIKYLSEYPQILDQSPKNSDRLYAKFGAGDTRPAELPENIALMSEGIIVFDHSQNGRRYAAKIYTDPQGKKILVGVDITQFHQNYDWMTFMSVIGIIMVLSVIIGSFMISVFVVRGTNDIAATARHIVATGDLSRRIAVRWRWDDLSHMAETLNILLGRIEQLMQGVRQVSDNIAHDLRTPLMRMKVCIDDLSRKYPDDEIAQKLAAEIDRVLGIFSALLRISRLESEKCRTHFQKLDLDQILRDAVEFYEPMAQEKSITVTEDIQTCTLLGDRDLLFQAFANILDNAVKFTPAYGRIAITAKTQDSKTTIEIFNSGSSVPEDDFERIFERFYRSAACRSEKGTGLGLSLAAAIIDLHHGRIAAENRPDGFCIITVF
jgi:signal transduction histidine kinase